jgi:pimeloyl-ACP methyl ester carboxylesterase
VTPVLLVHGFASSFELNWRQPGFVDLLQDAGRTVLPFDFLGHGTAPKSHDPADYDDLPASILAALPEGEVDAVGFSMGALMLLQAAVREPSRFRRLVIAGVGENVFSDKRSEAMAAAIEAGEADDGDVIGQLFVQFAKVPGNDNKALAACLRADRTPLTEEALSGITAATLVVIGDKDHAGPADRLTASIPGARQVVLRNTEHFATPRSFAFIDAALAFLDEG